jgi:hypothetical protein
MYKIIFIILLYLLQFDVQAQYNYKKVDSTSQALYIQKNWNALIDFSKKLDLQKYDYYLLNMRVGIAYFVLGDYKNSNHFFEKAYKNNSQNKNVIEYLYLTNLYLGNYKKAKYYFNKLDKDIQKRFRKENAKILNYIYAETGYSLAKAGNPYEKDILSFNIGLQHQFSPRLEIYHAYYFQRQELKFIKYNQSRYYLSPVYKLPNNYELRLSLNYVYYLGNINRSESYDYRTENDTIINSYNYHRVVNGHTAITEAGTNNMQSFYSQLNINKYFDKIKIGVFAGYTHTNSKFDTNTNIEINENIIYFYENNEVDNKDYPFQDTYSTYKKEQFNKYNAGIVLGMDINNKISVGLENIFVFSDKKIYANFLPTLVYKPVDKIKFALNYLYKDKQELYYQYGAQFLNNIYKMQETGLLTEINYIKNVQLYLVTNQNIIKYTDAESHKSYTFVLGIKYNLK